MIIMLRFIHFFSVLVDFASNIFLAITALHNSLDYIITTAQYPPVLILWQLHSLITPAYRLDRFLPSHTQRPILSFILLW